MRCTVKSGQETIGQIHVPLRKLETMCFIAMIYNSASKYAIKKVLVNEQRESEIEWNTSVTSYASAHDENILVDNINSIKTQKV